MNKKGFSLVELLAVLIILALIGLITYPVITKSVKDYRRRLCNVALENIVDASKQWAGENMYKLPVDKKTSDTYCSNDGSDVCILLPTLIEQGYLKKDFKNPLTGLPFQDYIAVRIYILENEYNYELINYEEKNNLNISSLDICG